MNTSETLKPKVHIGLEKEESNGQTSFSQTFSITVNPADFIEEDAEGNIFLGVIYRPTTTLKILKVRLDVAAG